MTGLRREVLIGLSSYGAYLAVRRAVWTDRGRDRADRNARALLRVERRLGLDVEDRIQALATRSPRLVRALNAAYAAGNVALSVGWLAVLYRRADPAFARERRAAVVAFTAALPFFLALPTAPPRSQDRFVDTMKDRGVDLDHPALVRFYNPIAALPSHHVAFAVVTGIGAAVRARHLSVRVGGLTYIALVALVVVATANHYVIDVLAGAVLGGVARRITR